MIIKVKNHNKKANRKHQTNLFWVHLFALSNILLPLVKKRGNLGKYYCHTKSTFPLF